MVRRLGHTDLAHFKTYSCTNCHEHALAKEQSRHARPNIAQMLAARKIALDTGLHYVYEGNIYSDGAHTTCPTCRKTLIRRSWHDVQENLLRDGACPSCGHKIPGRWTDPRSSSGSAFQRSSNQSAARKYGALNL